MPTESSERPVIDALSGFNPQSAVDLRTLSDPQNVEEMLAAVTPLLDRLEKAAKNNHGLTLTPFEVRLLMRFEQANANQIIYLLGVLEQRYAEEGATSPASTES